MTQGISQPLAALPAACASADSRLLSAVRGIKGLFTTAIQCQILTAVAIDHTRVHAS